MYAFAGILVKTEQDFIVFKLFFLSLLYFAGFLVQCYTFEAMFMY